MFQGDPSYEPFFIAINNRRQVIIGSNKKMVATYVIGELEVLVWIYKDINAENRVLLQLVPWECNMEKG